MGNSGQRHFGLKKKEGDKCRVKKSLEKNLLRCQFGFPGIETLFPIEMGQTGLL